MSPTSSNATQTDRSPVGRAENGKTSGDEAPFDRAALVPRVLHPLKVTIIEAMVWIGVPLSATDLDKLFDNRFGVAGLSYHLRTLAKAGVVKQTRSRQVRGAIERFYFPTDREFAARAVVNPK